MNDEGFKTIQNFSSYNGGGRAILELLKKYPNAKWSEDEDNLFGINHTNHPIEHFKDY